MVVSSGEMEWDVVCALTLSKDAVNNTYSCLRVHDPVGKQDFRYERFDILILF